MRVVLCLLLVAVLGAQALNIRTAVGADPATKKGALAPAPAAPAPQAPPAAGPADPSKGRGQQQQQDAEKEEDDDGKELKLVEKPLSPELQKIADERAANLKELKINETAPWVPLAADAENYELQYLTKLGQAAGKKLKSLKQLMALLSKEAADGMRDFDQVILSGKEKKPIVLYEVSKGKYDTKRPNNPGFAALATKKLSKVQAVMCKKPNGDVKKVCSKLLKAKQKVTDFLTGKINKLVDFVKDIFENDDNAPALIEEKTSTEIETQAKYKIYSQGAHHEQMVCEALKLATWVGVDPLLQNYITPHFNGATDCDDAISKFSSTYPQWWPTIGARWQDVPCFGSDAAVFDDSFVDTCYRLPNQYLNQLGYRSHISDRVYWHSMTSAQVALTHPTQRDIRSTIIRQARAWLRQATTPPPGYVNAIAMKPFLWNLGRVSHMIGDSFACGHCVRDALPPHGILYFQDYAGQSSPWRGEDHAYFDSHAQVGVSTGTLRVQALNQDLVQIFLAEATRVLTGAAYVPATPSGAGAANGRVELTRWMVANVYNFYSANHRAYNGLGCQVKSTTKNRVSACPQNLLGTADPANICPDFPRAPNTEFL